MAANLNSEAPGRSLHPTQLVLFSYLPYLIFGSVTAELEAVRCLSGRQM
jgi:hypothetical protein